MNIKKIIYSLCIDDIQQVAGQELGHQLTAGEISQIADKLGDYIDWYGAIESAISDCRMYLGLALRYNR